MSSVTKSVDVAVPVRTAYDQWTQFEEFPRFMKGVREVRQISDTMTHWVVEVGTATREFDAEITEPHPDEVSYRSFIRLLARCARVMPTIARVSHRQSSPGCRRRAARRPDPR